MFDKVKFLRFVNNKNFLPDSFTAYRNRIGLADATGDMLAERRQVVLSWPYKDCLLEGGQTREEARRQEVFWNETLGRAVEISSMGIRVSPESLDRQLTLSGCDYRRNLPFHKMLLAGELPLTIGGGIGQSRLCMLMMGCAHIGEVQSSIWDENTVEVCEKNGVPLL